MSTLRSTVGKMQLATFEPAELPQWINNAGGGATAAADTTLFTQGTQAYRITMPTGGQIIFNRLTAFDNAKIATGDTFSIWVYCSKVPNNWLRISLTNTLSLGNGNILRKDVSLASLTIGWNLITWSKSQMAAFGTWNSDPRALGIQIDIYHNVSESVYFVFDDFKVTIASDVRLSA